ncbi:MAG: hypothetical protein Q9191_007375, partial [Dirinaria sp. TL-2023a]
NMIVDKEISKEMRISHDTTARPSAADDVERGQTPPGLEQGAQQISLPSKCAKCGQPMSEARPQGHGKQMKSYLDAEVTTDHTDALMLMCCVISGFVDSTIYHAYGTFVSMQTGNTIFIGLGGSTGHSTNKPYGWAKSLVSVGCFVLGSFFFSRFHRIFAPLRRRTLITSFFIQTMIILLTAALIQTDVVNGTLSTISSDIDWQQAIPIALLSFQSAGQIVASRALSLSEIPSVVITSVLCDLASDPQLFVGIPRNAKRNRRILAFFSILVGAVAGGWLTTETGSIQWSLWLSGGLKFMITAAWSMWPQKV